MPMTCKLCKAGTARDVLPQIVKFGKTYSVYFCDACQNAFTDPVPTEEEQAALTRPVYIESVRVSGSTR